MTRIKYISRRTFIDFSRRPLTVVACLLAMAIGASAQSSATDGSTPAGYTAGAPAGSYSLSGFDTINFFNGNLNFNLPFLQLKGRGSSGHSLALKIERKWRKMKVTNAPYASGGGGWQIIQAGYGAGALEGRVAGMQDMCDGGWGASTLLRLTFTAPDGTEYELRDVLTGGAEGWTEYNSSCQLQTAPSRGRVFVTADGSSATFISDVDITDGNGEGPLPTGYLFLRDGTRFRVVLGKVTQMRDRNGNLTTYNFTDGRLSSVVDSLGRSATISYHPYGTGSDTIVYKGSGGATRTIRVWYTTLGSALRSGYSLQTYRNLFPELSGTSTTNYFNPEVVSSLELPDGRSYSFQYNSYGELARAVLPTGGAFEYDWDGGLSGGTSSGVLLNADGNIYRRLVEKRIYDSGGSGGSYTSRMTVSKPEDASSNNLGYVIVEQRNSSGTLLTKEVHYYYGSARASFLQDELDYSKWKEGKEWKTELFASNGTTVLRRTEHTWQQPSSTTTWPLTQAETSDNVRANDPQITQTVTTLVDTNQVTKQTFAYDKYCNKTDVYEYDYGSGSPPASWVRRSHTDYLTTNSVNSKAYDSVNPSTSSPDVSATFHLRGLPTQTQVFDAGGTEKSRTTFEYDYYVATLPRWALWDRTGISGLDGASTISYTPRGNVTRSTSWILSTSTPIHSYSHYDIAGNVVKVIDPLGNATSFDFTDNFGAPDGNVTTPTAPQELNGQYSFAHVTKITNALNHIVLAQFDYHLGRVVEAQDANGVIASVYSENDLLDRPTKVIRAANHTSVKNQTLFTYDDTAKTITTTSDHTSFNDLYPLKSQLVYDNLGRTIETRQYEGGTNYIATQQQYDALGRAYKTSNPFRPWSPWNETAVWTTTGFDALGRVTTVTTPDSAVVNTSYSGDTVTVTDQAGKARKSVTDALGRLKEVYEDPSGFNYLTSYTYDVLDSLTGVTQGTQTRSFIYDSLKRLISATNPESGTICYGRIVAAQCQPDGYDANGNLIYKTDARGVLTTYGYDVLNRNTTVDYSDATPDTFHQYDLATLGKGRLNQTWQGGSTTSATYVDSYDAMGRTLIQRQKFETAGVWSESYQVSRTYNLAGGVITQTYPSGRTVNYSYDDAGRTANLTGNLGDSVNRTYTTGISYSPLGGMTNEQFGTNTPLYNKSVYNNRGQLSEIRVSTNASAQPDWNRGAILNQYSDQCNGPSCNGTDNNGNLKRQEVFIPHTDQASPYTNWLQQYDYDNLNRLQRVKELNSSTLWQQEYIYDRWGNRSLHQTNTWGTGINKKDFTVNTANNRLGVPGGQSGNMTYDGAGNLTNDTYSGAGARTYDAENRMTKAWGGNNQWQEYTYNADGQRVRRKVDGVETRQVYGMDGELMAEYAGSAAPTSPQKEYGYRNGELLITVASTQGCGVGYTGAKTWTATNASLGHATGHQEGSTWAVYVGSDAANAMVYGPYDNSFGQGHHTAQFWLMVDNNSGTDVVATIDVVTGYGSNNLGQRQIRRNEFVGVNQWQVFTLEFDNPCFGLVESRVWWSGTVNMKFSQVTITTTSTLAVDLEWLVADQLGTPRMIANQTGTLTGVKRHDYLPFGEELYATQGVRTTGLGYDLPPPAAPSNSIRQKFTSKERDNETGLDYFLARYYYSMQGRFTSPDEFTGGPDELYDFAEDASENPTFYAEVDNPQSLNKYQYTYNNPLNMTDDDGHCPVCAAAARGAVVAAGRAARTRPGRQVINKAGAATTTIIVAAGGLAKKAFDWARTGNTAGDASCQGCESSRRMGQALMENNNSGNQNQFEGGAEGQTEGSNAQQPPQQKNDDKGTTGGRNQPKERTVEGAQNQLEGITREKKDKPYISTKKSEQNLDNEIKDQYIKKNKP